VGKLGDEADEKKAMLVIALSSDIAGGSDRELPPHRFRVDVTTQ